MPLIEIVGLDPVVKSPQKPAKDTYFDPPRVDVNITGPRYRQRFDLTSPIPDTRVSPAGSEAKHNLLLKSGVSPNTLNHVPFTTNLGARILMISLKK